MPRIPRRLTLPLLVLAPTIALLASCQQPRTPSTLADAQKPAPVIQHPTLSETQPQHLPGLENVVAFHDDFYSGGVPEGPEAFETLQAMGVKTIISVDGAIPDVASAQARGMRYIHLPIGYDGFDKQRSLQLTRATRDAMLAGPVYLHCHHGKHRSAGAAATVAVALGWSTPQAAVQRMKVSGTSPSYKGLYACASNAMVIPSSQIDAVPDDFPAVSIPKGLVKAMVEIDAAYEHLKLIQAAGWKTPADHPDLVPAAEAGRLADLYRLLAERAPAEKELPEFVEAMKYAQMQAELVESRILEGTSPDEPFRLVAASCKDCHTRFRD